MPSVPEAAMVPTASSGLYFSRSMMGNARVLSMTTEAPTMPVLAAMMMPRMATEMARPPRLRPSARSSE